MAEPVNRSSMPETDSIQELAEFWDTHDLTDFDDQTEEVAEKVFDRAAVVTVPLDAKAVEAVKKIAEARKIDPDDLIKEWIREKVVAHDLP